MTTSPRGFARPHLALAGLLGAGALALLAGCSTPPSRPYESRVANALPESDPATRGTVQGPRFLTEVEQVVVRMGRDADGRLVVLQVLSPVLTPEQQEEVRRAFAIGGWKRQVPMASESESWIETIVKNKP